MDMISDLPELILHNIMSSLPDLDSARTAVLSKSWRQKRSTFPILVFVLDESRYVKNYKKPLNKRVLMRKRSSFYNFVDNSLLRFHNQCLTIKQLKLSLDLYNDIESSYPHIDYWMELARECRVEVLHLTCRLPIPRSKAKRYHIPSSVLEAKSLVKLSLDGHISFDQAFFNHPNKFSSLEVLCLASVHFVDKQVFQNLLASCPLIEYITLDMCRGIDSVFIHGLSKLKGIKVVGFLMEVEIDAPSLQNFYYNPATVGIIRHPVETKIKMDKCVNLYELSLVKLILGGRISLDQAFLNHQIKFSSLKVLCLTSVHFVDKQVFQNLLTSCPLIEYITLDMCHGIDTVCIHGLSQLKGVKVVGFIMEVEIDAPTLQNFHYNSAATENKMETNIKMDKCINLNELCLTGLKITQQWFLQHYYLFTTLQILELRFCTMPEWTNMACFDIKVIKLEGCNGIRNASICAPKLNLCSYIYHGACNNLPVISFLNGSKQLEISVTLSICGALVYWKLKRFFQELACRNVLATLSMFHIGGAVETDALQDFSVPPPVIKHLHLHASFEQIICFPLVAGLLWSCHPSIISCGLSNRTIIKVLCEALMSGKKEECVCSSRLIKCWWHDLKDVKVTCSSGTDRGNEISFDCKTFLDALPTLTEGDVSFRLE